MFKLLIVGLSALAICQARVVIQDCMDGVSVNSVKHAKEYLRKNMDSPYQLAIDYDTNTLFFSYTQTDGDETFKSAYFNLKTHEFNKISGIHGGFANAVDGKNHIVYLGGSDGVYKYDFDTNTAHFKTARDKNVWAMFFKDKLYFTTYPDETAYVYANGETKQVETLTGTRARLVAVDSNDDLYFVNSTGLFKVPKHQETFDYKGSYNINGFTTDIDGNLFFSTPEAIYSIDSESNIKRIAHVKSIFGIAIEGDQSIIYATDNGIIRLRSTGILCNNVDDDDKVNDNEV